MSGLNSYKSWKDLNKPPNPFFGAMFSRSHRKRKRKRFLQPIDNPKERGRSLDKNKDLDSTNGIRSISVENATILKLKHETFKDLLLDPYSHTIMSTDSSLDLKKIQSKPLKIPESIKKDVIASQSASNSIEHSVEDKYAELDKAISNNSINMRKKFIKPLHPDNPKPLTNFRRGRKFIKSPTNMKFLPFAPDLKPVSINSFQVGLACLELEVNQFFNDVQEQPHIKVENLIKNINCKFILN